MTTFAIHRPGILHEPGTIYLGLIDLDPGCVMLAAVDEDGHCLLDPRDDAGAGGLLCMTAEGRVALSPAVMPSLGLDLDCDGRLLLDAFAERMTALRARGPKNKARLKAVSGQCPPGNSGHRDE